MKTAVEVSNEAIAFEQIRELFQVPGQVRMSPAEVVREVKALVPANPVPAKMREDCESAEFVAGLEEVESEFCRHRRIDRRRGKFRIYSKQWQDGLEAWIPLDEFPAAGKRLPGGPHVLRLSLLTKGGRR